MCGTPASTSAWRTCQPTAAATVSPSGNGRVPRFGRLAPAGSPVRPTPARATGRCPPGRPGGAPCWPANRPAHPRAGRRSVPCGVAGQRRVGQAGAQSVTSQRSVPPGRRPSATRSSRPAVGSGAGLAARRLRLPRRRLRGNPLPAGIGAGNGGGRWEVRGRGRGCRAGGGPAEQPGGGAGGCPLGRRPRTQQQQCQGVLAGRRQGRSSETPHPRGRPRSRTAAGAAPHASRRNPALSTARHGHLLGGDQRARRGRGRARAPPAIAAPARHPWPHGSDGVSHGAPPGRTNVTYDGQVVPAAPGTTRETGRHLWAWSSRTPPPVSVPSPHHLVRCRRRRPRFVLRRLQVTTRQFGHHRRFHHGGRRAPGHRGRLGPFAQHGRGNGAGT